MSVPQEPAWRVCVFHSIHNLESAFTGRARVVAGRLLLGAVMKDFSEATFVPEMIDAMTEALDASVATLPHPVSSTQVNLLAESILRTAQTGERDPAILQRMALLELQITPRD
jgi:hypothetical protein